mgnify:FL=1
MFHNIQYKRTHILLTIVQIILVGMILGWYYFSERKMGMIGNIFLGMSTSFLSISRLLI